MSGPLKAVDAPDLPAVLTRRLTLSAGAALRREPFGALAYHYESRRLVFLRDRVLTEVVSSLAEHDDALHACETAGVTPDRLPSFAAALDGLLAAGVLEPLAD